MAGAQTETLTPAQIADLDPFGLRKLRAGESADEFLGVGEGSEDARGALRAAEGVGHIGRHDDLIKSSPVYAEIIQSAKENLND